MSYQFESDRAVMPIDPKPVNQTVNGLLPPLVFLRPDGVKAVDWRIDPTPNQTDVALRHYAQSIGAPNPYAPRSAQASDGESENRSIGPAHLQRRARLLRRLLLRTTASALVVIGSACSTSAPSGGLADLETIAKQCDGAERTSLIATDESDTSRGATSQPIRLQVIQDEVTRTAVCGGHVRLTVFSGSVVGQMVFDGDLATLGATETSRLRKIPKLVDQTMAAIGRGLPAARASLPGDGTDIAGQYEVAAEYFAQQGATARSVRTFTVLTDGISTVPTGLTDRDLTTAEARRLARTVTPAQLPGVTVRIIGVGRTSGDEQLPSAYVDALKVFQTEVCQASQAASCLIVTDPESGGAR